MSPEEDFRLVMSENTLEGVKASITNYKKKLEQLLQDQKELAASKGDQRHLAQEFRRRTEKLTQSLKEDKCCYKEQLDNETARRNCLKHEEVDLMLEIRKLEAALKEEEAQCYYLKQQTDVFTASPERRVFFSGVTAKADDTQKFDMESRIVYPMEGGTTLVTYEEEEVAKKILDMKKHRVDLGGDCCITVEARPVQLLMPSFLEICSDVCTRRILISNLPKMDREILKNKLEIHFSKTKNGGGEVEDCDMVSDSWTVVLTFVGKDVAKGLTDKEYHEVDLQQTQHRVRVTPFVNGNITNLKTKMSVCPRTLLLTGIPPIMEQETLQDVLEIHFQRTANGGGEIKAFLYNPLGQHTSAVFDDQNRKED